MTSAIIFGLLIVLMLTGMPVSIALGLTAAEGEVCELWPVGKLFLGFRLDGPNAWVTERGHASHQTT